MITNRDDVEIRLGPLWQRAQGGDETAYRQALGLAAARLRGYFRRRLPAQPNEVEDLVQETLLALHLQRATHDPQVPVSAWLHGIARHKFVDWLRRQGRERETFEPWDADDGRHEPQGPDDAEEGATRRDLARLLDALPAAHRRAIVDTKIEGLSVAESARQAGVSESAVKVHVHRGLQRLAALMRGKA